MRTILMVVVMLIATAGCDHGDGDDVASLSATRAAGISGRVLDCVEPEPGLDCDGNLDECLSDDNCNEGAICVDSVGRCWNPGCSGTP